MDIATLVGLISGLVLILGAIALESSLMEFVSVHAISIVFGGTAAAILIAFPLKQVVGAFAVARQCFQVRVSDAREELQRFVELAQVARRDGLLGLEQRISQIKDPFLRRGLEMVVDNTPVDKLHDTLTIEMSCLQERHHLGKKIFEQMGALFPAMGMVGTLIGLVQMLSRLEDPSKIGAGMATAMIATFYGAAGSNLIFLPLANKLETRSKEEIHVRELMIRGLTYILEGDGPRAVESKLTAFLAPKARSKKDDVDNAA